MAEYKPVEPPAEGRKSFGIRETRAGIADAGVNCPACKALIASNSAMCVKCGLDFRTGRRVQAVASGSSIPWGLVLRVALILLIAVGAYAGFTRGRVWYGARVETLKKGREAYVTNYVHCQAPPCSIGETVTLHRVDGAACTALLCGHGPGGALLEDKSGRIVHVPMDVFDIWSRVRLDETLRAHIIRINTRLPSEYKRFVPLVLWGSRFDWPLVLELPAEGPRMCSFCQDSGRMDCPSCGGRGSILSQTEKDCHQCRGTGKYAAKLGAGHASCPFCSGTGRLPDSQSALCADCGGQGRVPCTHCSTAATARR